MTPTELRIREAALRLFSEKGFEATGIRDLAHEAGISVASLYHYMSNKEDLLVDLMEYGLQRLIGAAQGAVERADDPVTQLASLIQLHVWVHGVRQQSTRVVDNEIRSLTGERLERIRDLRDGYERIWRGVIRQGVAAGSMAVLDPKLASFALLEMCTGVARWYSRDGELALLYIAESFADLGLGLVRASINGEPIRSSDLEVPNPSELYGADPAESNAALRLQ